VLVGKRAWGVVLSPDDSALYVANGLSDDLTIVDTAKLKAVRTISVGRVPHTVVVDD
jgi:YVTN family beta-propeller protein